MSHGIPVLPPLDRLPAGRLLPQPLLQQRLVKGHMVGGAGLGGGVADDFPAGDGVQPGGETAGITQARERPERSHERLLADVFRHGPRPDLPKHRRQHGRPVPRDEAIESGDVPHQALHHQLRVLEVLP